MSADLPSNSTSFFTYSAALLSAMAGRERLVILRSLMDGEMSLNGLSLLTGLGRTVCSEELARLQDAGLVHRRVERETAYFSCRSAIVKRVLEALDDIRPDGEGKDGRKDRP